MKKLFAAMFILVLAGAGCLGGGLGGGNQEEQGVSGDWWLTFDLPEGWAMVSHYQSDESNPTDAEVSRDLADVVLQSTTLPIVLEGDEPEEGIDAYEDTNYTYIRVFRYDARTSVPADSEDLGNNFFKRVRDDGSVAYYFVGEQGKYKFVVEQEGQDLSAAEAVILTAQDVTNLE